MQALQGPQGMRMRTAALEAAHLSSQAPHVCEHCDAVPSYTGGSRLRRQGDPPRVTQVGQN